MSVSVEKRRFPVDIRLVCATHQDLKKMVEEGKFREDLYYRIHVIHLHIPPLRERKEDIPWLAGRLLETWSAEHSDPRTLHRSAEKALLDHPGRATSASSNIALSAHVSSPNKMCSLRNYSSMKCRWPCQNIFKASNH